MKTELNNYGYVVEDIAQTMRALDREALDYQTDIYLYIDDEGNGTVETFPNPGGNSWRNDDHILVYEDKPHYDDYYDEISSFFEDDEDMGWDDLADTLKDEILPDLDAYIEKAAWRLDRALNQ